LRADSRLFSDGLFWDIRKYPGNQFGKSQYMKVIRRKRGRPPSTGKGVLVAVRCQADFLALIDRWRTRQPVPPSRPAAIRHLAELGLKRGRKPG
jgi:hypothetical protein